MFNLSKSDEIDLHYGKRDPASMSYSEAMCGVTDVVETGQHDALQGADLCDVCSRMV
jgi:hypothetical protein